MRRSKYTIYLKSGQVMRLKGDYLTYRAASGGGVDVEIDNESHSYVLVSKQVEAVEIKNTLWGSICKLLQIPNKYAE